MRKITLKHFLNKLFLVSVMLVIGQVLHAQNPVLPVGNAISSNIKGQIIQLKTTNAYAEIIVYSPSVIRIKLDKQPLKDITSYAVVAEQV